MKLTTALYPNWVRGHHIHHVREGPSFSTDIYDFLINWQGEHLAGRRVGCSHLLPVLARSLRGSTVSACVKLLGNVYNFRISWNTTRLKLAKHLRLSRRPGQVRQLELASDMRVAEQPVASASNR
jgi:hypothetical protein